MVGVQSHPAIGPPVVRTHGFFVNHDASYKLLYAERRTVADLLRDSTGPLAGDLDYSTLTKLPTNFVGEDLGQRHADMLWKVRFKDRAGRLLRALWSCSKRSPSR